MSTWDRVNLSDPDVLDDVKLFVDLLRPDVASRVFPPHSASPQQKMSFDALEGQLLAIDPRITEQQVLRNRVELVPGGGVHKATARFTGSPKR